MSTVNPPFPTLSNISNMSAWSPASPPPTWKTWWTCRCRVCPRGETWAPCLRARGPAPRPCPYPCPGPIRGEYQLSVSTNHSSPSCPWRAAAASPARPPCGPIRSEYCGHVTSSPPMTAHLAARCSASILSFSSLRSSASFSATALALDTR